MAIKKTITVDGIEVPFKASAAVPRLYRIKFRRDIYKDFAALQTSVQEGDEEGSTLDIESLEVFENIAYIMAKHAIRKTCRTIRMNGSKRSTHSPSTRCCRSSSSCGDSTWKRRRNLKKHRKTDRPMTTPLFLLRCVQIGLSLSELDLLTIGVVNDMFTEMENDEYDGWHEVAGQADFDAF